ncbi:MAG TPA: WhiB family transcriptional regulator, partial [Actinobacteria bacterium]|nr:WhiB family transcriptional regulator [Actinomycetota bacterium]
MADLSRLPGPNADLWDWQLEGACRGLDSAVFFHPEGERGSARARREA